MTRRRAFVVDARFPYLVATDADRTVLGYAYAGPFRTRPAYRFTCEDSIYVGPSSAGRGVGTALLAELMDRCTRLQMRLMVAVIGDSANTGSIRLHARLGFQSAGLLPASGWKHGQWVDTVLMTRPLGVGAASPPDQEAT